MKINIQVTDEDISRASSSRSRNADFTTTCPIARAIKRELSIKTLYVGTNGVFRNPNRSEPFIKLPRKAVGFINRFDADKKVKPINFPITYGK